MSETWADPAAPPFLAAVNPASDTPDPARDWPKDALHEAAGRVVGGMRHLAPQARAAVRKAAEDADRPPSGREAQDHALGRATR